MLTTVDDYYLSRLLQNLLEFFLVSTGRIRQRQVLILTRAPTLKYDVYLLCEFNR